LDHVPSKIQLLPQLRILAMDNNSISEMPVDLAHQVNLEELSLDGNRISVIPSDISLLTNLRTLGVENNRVTALPNGARYLSRLTSIRLDAQKMVSPPREIALQGPAKIMQYFSILFKAPHLLIQSTWAISVAQVSPALLPKSRRLLV